MPAFQTFLGELNVHMGQEKLAKLATDRAQHFAPGSGLDLSFLADQQTPLGRSWRSYVGQLPPAIQETVRAVLHQALSTTPPTAVTFAWAPGYDYEVTVWQAPDTNETKGGITVLLKSRYPSDKHPIAKS